MLARPTITSILTRRCRALCTHGPTFRSMSNSTTPNDQDAELKAQLTSIKDSITSIKDSITAMNNSTNIKLTDLDKTVTGIKTEVAIANTKLVDLDKTMAGIKTEVAVANTKLVDLDKTTSIIKTEVVGLKESMTYKVDSGLKSANEKIDSGLKSTHDKIIDGDKILAEKIETIKARYGLAGAAGMAFLTGVGYLINSMSEKKKVKGVDGS